MSSAPPLSQNAHPGSKHPNGFGEQLTAWQSRMESALRKRLPEPAISPVRLHEAMGYSVLGGGKRIRPALLFATARAIGLTEEQVEGAACAIELIHVYSLVHDDLPAMDDDDLRRGRPTCHKAFDEAIAVLAGDALQTLTFLVLSRDPNLPACAAVRLRLVEILAEASGSFGMAGGQAIDLGVQGQRIDLPQIEAMHMRKTGALIRASVLLAAACRPTLDPQLLHSLERFAEPIGLAFQIQDDLLDVLGDVATLGKATGADRDRAKPTYPALLGITASQERVRLLHAQAIEALGPFGSRAADLRDLADWLLSRHY